MELCRCWVYKRRDTYLKLANELPSHDKSALQLQVGDFLRSQLDFGGLDVDPHLFGRARAGERVDALGLVVDIGQGDVGHGDAFAGGQFLRPILALEVFLDTVDLDRELIVAFGQRVEIVAAKAAAEESAGQTGPDEEGDAVLPAPGARRPPGWPAETFAVDPGRYLLHGQAELGAADHERGQPMRGGIGVNLSQAFDGPIGAAVSVDLSGLPGRVQRLDKRADRHARIIAVKQVEVKVVDFEARQAVVDVGLDIEGRHSSAVLAVVRALGEDDDLVAHAAAVDPLTNGALIVAAAVDMGGVDAVAAGRVKSVQRGKGGIEIAGINPHRPLHEPGNRFVDAGNVGIEHVRNSSVKGANRRSPRLRRR